MHGQFYGEFEPKQGGKGFAWTLIDPDRMGGQVTFQGKTGTLFVAELRISSMRDRAFTLEIVPNQQLEQFYGPSVQSATASPVLRAELELDEPQGFAKGEVTDPSGAFIGKLEMYRLRPWAAQSQKSLASWRECKEWMDSHRHEGPSLYRGQGKPLPMTTTFHRTGRVDLIRYLQSDANIFADYVTTYGDRRYDMNQASDRGAIVALAQHHGFPSPLLDWSFSPYIAASFAFSSVLESAPSDSPARLFRLTPAFLRDFPPSSGNMQISPWPKVELFRPPSLGNTRMLSQQGMFLFSNVPSPEAQLQFLEQHFGKTYLEIVDIPADGLTCREALTDLRRMGITAASLFPGLDGIGRALKHELFYAYDGAPPPAVERGASPESEKVAPAPAKAPARKSSKKPR